jgi:hypothetical protein
LAGCLLSLFFGFQALLFGASPIGFSLPSALFGGQAGGGFGFGLALFFGGQSGLLGGKGLGLQAFLFRLLPTAGGIAQPQLCHAQSRRASHTGCY